MKRILVAVDFSPATGSVIKLARELAKALSAEIHLVHVREVIAAAGQGVLGSGLAGMPELAPMSGLPFPTFDSAPQRLPQSDMEKSQLVQWQSEIRQEGVKVSLHEPSGAVADEILNQADTNHVDLIVMGTHGHGAMYHLLVGSVTKGVLKHATRPVLLVPGHSR